MNQTTFKKRVSSILTDNAGFRYSPLKRAGILDNPRLSRLYTDTRPSCFKTREIRLNRAYDIRIMLDCSGSMAGEKMANGIASLFALANSFKHLKECGLRIYGFNRVLREFSIPDNVRLLATSIKASMMSSEFHNDFTSGNHDGYHLLRVAVDCLKSAYPAKIIMVLSDGAPSCDLCKHGQPGADQCQRERGEGAMNGGESEALEKAVSFALKNGINLCSLGILSNDVTYYYPKKNTEVVWRTEDIFNASISILSRLIKRGV